MGLFNFSKMNMSEMTNKILIEAGIISTSIIEQETIETNVVVETLASTNPAKSTFAEAAIAITAAVVAELEAALDASEIISEAIENVLSDMDESVETTIEEVVASPIVVETVVEEATVTIPVVETPVVVETVEVDTIESIAEKLYNSLMAIGPLEKKNKNVRKEQFSKIKLLLNKSMTKMIEIVAGVSLKDIPAIDVDQLIKDSISFKDIELMIESKDSGDKAAFIDSIVESLKDLNEAPTAEEVPTEVEVIEEKDIDKFGLKNVEQAKKSLQALGLICEDAASGSFPALVVSANKRFWAKLEFDFAGIVNEMMPSILIGDMPPVGQEMAFDLHPSQKFAMHSTFEALQAFSESLKFENAGLVRPHLLDRFKNEPMV